MLNKRDIHANNIINTEADKTLVNGAQNIVGAQAQQHMNALQEGAEGAAEVKKGRKKSLLDYLNNSKGAGRRRLVNKVPTKKTLKGVYASKFSSRYSEEKRETKINYNKSRLFVKQEVSRNINIKANSFNTQKYKLMASTMEGRKLGCDIEEFHDLSVFMVNGDVLDDNKKLLDNYIGKSRNPETRAIEGQNRNEAIDYMTRQFFSLDVSDIDFTTDKGISESAFKLEAVVSYVGAYERILDRNPDYLDGLGRAMKNGILMRVEELRAVANYYLARKELINDDYYRTHYDDELSMEVSEDASEDQKRVAEKLINSYILGKELVRVHSKSGKSNITDRKLKSSKSKELYQKALLLENYDKNREYLIKAYSDMDHLAGGLRLDPNNLELTGGDRAKLLYLAGPNTADLANAEGLDEDTLRKDQQKKEKMVEEVYRPDIEKNKERLRNEGFDPAGYILANPYMNYRISGLGIIRILNLFGKTITAHMGSDDICDMLRKMIAPQLPENQGLDKDSDRVKKLNRDFSDAVKTFKKVLYHSAKSLINTFGALPTQLTFGDIKKLMLHYGDMFKELADIYQDVGQLLDNDTAHVFTDEDTNSEDRELRYFVDSIGNERVMISVVLTNDFYGAYEPSENNYAAKFCNGRFEKAKYYTGDMEKSSIMTGPVMSERQLEKYKADKKSSMTPGDYASYLGRREVFENVFGNVISMWNGNVFASFKSRVNEIDINSLTLYKKQAQEIQNTLHILKECDFWDNPQESDQQPVRDAIQFARDNEQFLEVVTETMEKKIEPGQHVRRHVLSQNEGRAGEKAR